jgi:hypothetical protein
MNSLIFNQGAFAGGVFAGDNFISSFWGVGVLVQIVEVMDVHMMQVIVHLQ